MVFCFGTFMIAPLGASEDTRLDWSSVSLPALTGPDLTPDMFKGKVVLLVNTASQCGFTPQYEGLQALWMKYRDQGLVVLGVPSNDFGQQEPGNNSQVQDFCKVNYGVTFPMLEKQVVVGEKAHKLYRWAASQTGFLGTPKWNFHKILIGRDGHYISWFSSLTEPNSESLTRAIEKSLQAKQGSAS
jgi:glutathione peroxidase